MVGVMKELPTTVGMAEPSSNLILYWCLKDLLDQKQMEYSGMDETC